MNREESVEVKNRGTPEEEFVFTGSYSFRAEDGFKYIVRYTLSKTGSDVTIDRIAIHRIPPNALKSLVG